MDLTRIANQTALGFRQSESKARANGIAHRLELDLNGAQLVSVAGARQHDRVAAKVSALLAAKDKDSYRVARTSLRQALTHESPELSLRAFSVARSGYECIRGPGLVAVTAENAAVRRFDSCSEHWENGETSAEQSFRFEQRPGGDGDLVIQIRTQIGGVEPAATTSAADGLHLQGATGERYVYGHGHWIDAAGHRIEVPATYSSGVIALRIPASTIDGSTYPAVLDPVVGPEIGTDPPVAVATTLGAYPALASDGSGFLAAQSVNGRIRAVRVDNGGNVLDLPWIDFGEVTGSQYYPYVTWGNGHYLVTWSHFGDETTSSDDSIRGRFVKSDGTLEGAANFQLADSTALYMKLVWGGTRYIATWLGTSGTGVNNIQAALFNGDGGLVAGSQRAVSASGNATDPCIALGTNQALIAWEDYSQSSAYAVNAARFGTDGTLKDATPLAISPTGTNSKDVALGSSGSDFLVAWTTDSGNYAVRGAVVNDAGSVAASNFALSHSSGTAALPAVDFDGTNFLVAWADSRDGNSVYGVNVSPTGTSTSTTDSKLATGSPARAYPGSLDRVNLAYNGSRHLVSFAGSGIEGSLVEKNLTVVNGKIPLTALANPQGFPSMVFDGKNYVVVWADERNGSSSSDMIARGVRISGSGEVLDPSGISISPTGAPAFSVTVASVGNQTSQLFYAPSGAAPSQRTLTSDGTLGDPKAFGSVALGSNVTVQSNGTTYLALTPKSSSSVSGVYGRILDASGNAGSEFTIDTGTSGNGGSIVPTKGGYLVAYSNSGTRVVTVSDLGQVGTSSLFASGYQYVDGASSSTETLVVWSNMTDYKVHGRFFKEGAFTGTEFTLAEGSLGYTPAITWDGTNYLVVWEVANHNLLGRSVSSSGALGTTYVLVGDDCAGPVLASNGQGQVLLSYAKYGPLWLNRRVYSRLITQSGTSNVPEASAGASGMSGRGGSSGTTTAGGTGNTATGGNATTTTGGSGGTGTSVSAGGSSSTGTSTTGGTNQGGTSATTANGIGGSSTGSTTSTVPSGIGGSGAAATTGGGGTTGTANTMGSGGAGNATSTSTSKGGTGAATTTNDAVGGASTTSTTTNTPIEASKPPADDGGCRINHGKPSRPWFALVAGAAAMTVLRRRRRRA